MALPARIRVQTQAPFPTAVIGSGPVTVAKVNGIWTIGFSFAPLPIKPAVATDYVLVQDASTGVDYKVTLSTIAALATGLGYRLVTAAGDVAIASSDTTIVLQKTVGAATNINLPASSTRSGLAITVKDLKGDANTNNITFVPQAGETIDGFSAAAAITNGAALITTNYGRKTLYPLTSGGWYL